MSAHRVGDGLVGADNSAQLSLAGRIAGAQARHLAAVPDHGGVERALSGGLEPLSADILVQLGRRIDLLGVSDQHLSSTRLHQGCATRQSHSGDPEQPRPRQKERQVRPPASGCFDL
ncbi:MAG: hypothetical protein ACI9ZH_001796 [Paracoccaceae bacterium]|jgi:hypothetical protein